METRARVNQPIKKVKKTYILNRWGVVGVIVVSRCVVGRGEASLLMRGVVVTHDLATALFAPYGERGGWVAGEEGEIS